MQRTRIVGLLLVSLATWAQQTQPVELTSEPSHHLVFENQYVRVFDVTVAPKASTLVHQHNNDYVFVTLGDSDVVNARQGEKPVPLQLKDGETRFTPGHFAHAAINRSDRPFHNITIEILKPSTEVHTCPDACVMAAGCASDTAATNPTCPTIERRISAGQWTLSYVNMPPNTSLPRHTHAIPHLVVAVSDLDLLQVGDASTETKLRSGGLAWVPAGVTHTLKNNSSQAARYVALEFNAEKP